jgi:hypothetical protein
MTGVVIAGRPSTRRRRARLAQVVLLCAFLFFAAAAGRSFAHDIPTHVQVHLHAKPEGDRLHVLARIPLSLLLNLDLPKRGPGYLDLAQIEPALTRAVAAVDTDVRWFADGQRLALIEGRGRISPPSDRSFDTFEAARSLVEGPPLAPNTFVFWNQGYFDAHLQYPLPTPQAGIELDFDVAPGLRDRLKLDLRFIHADGTRRAYDLATGAGRVALDPRWHQAASTFLVSGFRHILDGPDHLLFLLCLVLPFRRLSVYLLAVVTSFTVAHSITLLAAAYGLTPEGQWFQPLVELLIAASVVYMAIENIFNRDIRRRWLWSGVFGLVHGFGFSFVLASELQFAGSHLLLSLLAFNIGIEFGQLLVLLIIIPATALFLRTFAVQERTLTLVVSVLVAHTAWHWAVERAEAFWAADWSVASVMSSLAPMVAIVVVAAASALALAMFNRQRRAAGLQRQP